VSALLQQAGYKRLTVPLAVGGLQFALAAAFIGTGVSPDLLVIVDAAFEKEQRIQQRIEGLARALDIVESRRPLTVIVAGPRFSDNVGQLVSRVSRMLSVDDAADEAKLYDALAVLLPLKLPDPKDGGYEGMDLDAIVGEGDAEIAGLVEAAISGEGAVRERLFELIAEPFDSLSLEAEDEE
jgi:hypothetical protein